MSIKELRNEINKLKKEKIEITPLLIEINEKITLAFSCLAFILLGIPLAVITRRREKTINFGIVFVIMGLYYLLLMGSEAVCLQGYVNPQITMWIPNALLGIIGAILTFRLCAY